MASLFELLGWIQWDDLEGQKSRESGVFEYSTSKLELIMMMRHLNKQLKVLCSLRALWHSASCILCPAMNSRFSRCPPGGVKTLRRISSLDCLRDSKR